MDLLFLRNLSNTRNSVKEYFYEPEKIAIL